MPAQEATTNDKNNNKLARASMGPQTIEKPWFYSVLLPSGAIFKGGSESSAAFMDKVNSATIAWVDYVTQDADFDKEALNAAAQIGFSSELVSPFGGESYMSYLDLDVEIGMKMPTIQVKEFEVEAYPLLLLLRKNVVLTVHPLSVDRRFLRLRRYSETVLKRIPVDAASEDKLTLLLMRIIDENNDRNFEHLREIEARGDELNESMTDYSTPRTELAPKIYQMKHALITYLNALWDTVHVLHTLRYGDAELITNDARLLDKMGIVADDVNRQIGLGEHMSEVLASGLEVLQSIYNNQLQNLNNRLALIMTYLTIIGTALLVPNTLATVLGDAVWDLGPKDMWWYLPVMIGSTVAATIGAYWWVRKRGWIPKKMD